jgi:hypothetical protein
MMNEPHKTPRRDFIKVGTLSLLGLSLSLTDLFWLEKAVAATPRKGASPQAKSVILIWLDGGPSQYDTFDPKPQAPSDVKSEFGAIKTNVPGLEICALMPQMAGMSSAAHRMDAEPVAGLPIHRIGCREGAERRRTNAPLHRDSLERVCVRICKCRLPRSGL